MWMCKVGSIMRSFYLAMVKEAGINVPKAPRVLAVETLIQPVSSGWVPLRCVDNYANIPKTL